MDLRKIIHELELEKQRLDEAIVALERLSLGGGSYRSAGSKAFDTTDDSRIHEAHAAAPGSQGPTHSIRK